ncbi:mitochondrial carrier protein-like protein [Lotmaria passim]
MLAHSKTSEYVQRRGASASLCTAAATTATTATTTSIAPSSAPASLIGSDGRKASPAAVPHGSKASATGSRGTLATATSSSTSTADLYADTEVVAMASSSAALLTKSVLHPLDTLKCRVQLLRTDILPPNANCSTWRGLMRTRLRQLRHQYAGQWAPRYLYGGLPVKLAFYVPYQALYLSSYNYAQRALQDGWEREVGGGNGGRTHRNPSYLWRTVAAAVFAEIATFCLRVPMETMKMRVQSTATTSSVQAVVQLWRQGLRSNLRLVVPHTIMHDIPYSVIQWVMYESLRPWTQQWGAKLPSSSSAATADGTMTTTTFFSRYGAELARTFLSGGFSGLLASTLTVPLDNIRTRTVVATASDPKLTVGRVVRVTYQREGLRGFVRGSGMRVLWVTTNMACFYPLFEGICYILQCRADAKKETAVGGH